MSSLAVVRRKRSPSIVFACLSVAILFLMMTALNQAQPPPPPTPEYAPEAVQAVRNPLREQTSRFGKGPEGSEGGAPGGPRPTPSASIDPNRTKLCVGGRQIEDPQSPRCADYWDPKRDNDGSTYPGVTRDEIRIGVPGGFAWDNQQLYRMLVTFFNQRFEFYGRRIVPVEIPDCGGWKPDDMKTCAASAKAMNIFASTSYVDVGGNQQYYYDALAKHGIVSTSSHPDRRTEAHLASQTPFQWTYLPAFDRLGAHLASFACRQLLSPGARASHGGEDVQTKPRKIGLIYNHLPESPPMDIQAFVNGMRACGVVPETASVKYVKEGYGYQSTDDESAREAATAVASFRLDDVTTIVCLCHLTTTRQAMVAADGQGFKPEWIVSSYGYHSNLAMTALPATQTAHTLGLDLWNKVIDESLTWWYQATQSVNPNYNYEGIEAVYFGAMFNYHQLLLLASGIQLAGPILNPDSFQAGLWSEGAFPNPPGDYFEGKVGFADRDHSMMNDVAITWWDPAGRDPWISGARAFCYVRLGTRFEIGTYPQVDELFRGRRGPGLCDRGAGER